MFGGWSTQAGEAGDRLVQPGGEKALGMGGTNCGLSLPKRGCYRGARLFPGVRSNSMGGSRHRLQQEQFLLGRRFGTGCPILVQFP